MYKQFGPGAQVLAVRSVNGLFDFSFSAVAVTGDSPVDQISPRQTAGAGPSRSVPH